MSRQLVFIHGRSQEHKEADRLKADWIAAWKRGLAKSELDIPIDEADIRFPYYGQALFDLAGGAPDDQVADIIVRGPMADADLQQKTFVLAVLQEVADETGVDPLADGAEGDLISRGVQNWEFVQGILRAIDRHIPGSSGASIALATSDVYQYLRNPGMRDRIETGIRPALRSDAETVIVSHSLGTVVAYNLLRRDGLALRWKVPLFVTLGSPLGVTAIRKALRPIDAVPCVDHWYNAMDERDVVALYPLNADHFDIAPPIENNTRISNDTANRHGISGYLDDKEVAQRIHAALVAA
ncbi:hypothetical protein [Cupriavidus sp. AcVe19-6a]|uniref:hypothetical protein n=1 Tax=Cupriavidus sp. AcVe19-6a TaxID=2821358 RepID=UPI001AE43EFE|nr:hypothetical protein [Cupriavidus sp. AcVe19-6a]MBP0639444.1 hypothetical protein [Cupriavidus sp. AcVe19-6a]